VANPILARAASIICKDDTAVFDALTTRLGTLLNQVPDLDYEIRERFLTFYSFLLTSLGFVLDFSQIKDSILNLKEDEERVTFFKQLLD